MGDVISALAQGVALLGLLGFVKLLEGTMAGAAIDRKKEREEAETLFGMDLSKVNIGVTGGSGSGKSSLINRIRGLRYGAPGWATEGVVETTQAPQVYTIPGIKEAVLWDMPGVGTPKHPHATYFRKQRLVVYDVVVLVSDTRFTEFDMQVITKMEEFGVPYILVRTKVDCAVAQNAKRGKDRAATLAEIKADVVKNIPETRSREAFCICNDLDVADPYDFRLLIETICVTVKTHRRKLTDRARELAERHKARAASSGGATSSGGARGGAGAAPA